MALWRIDIYYNSTDSLPFKSGYCHAESEEEAQQKVKSALEAEKDAKSASGIKVTAHSIPKIPTDKVLWDHL